MADRLRRDLKASLAATADPVGFTRESLTPPVDDGGPAFPAERTERIRNADYSDGFEVVTVTYPGMSLRDWFAGQALAGILASMPTGPDDKPYEQAAANDAYTFADAMLAARKGGSDVG